VTLFQALGIFASGGAGAAAAPGMVLMNPTSIAYSGTSATLGANGQVTFSAVTSLSLNGVFTADFDNYVVSAWSDASVGSQVYFRMRVSGTDNSTANSYVRQQIAANDTSVSAVRITGDAGAVFVVAGTQIAGTSFSIYGPYLAQPTATRATSVWDFSSARFNDQACTHNQSTSYDGITFFVDNGNITGALQVYGVRS
jgi:hypothetical protein